jgi:hypothetical protein
VSAPIVDRVVLLRLESEQNLREHWSARDRRARAQKTTVTMILRPVLHAFRLDQPRNASLRLRVSLQRLIGPRGQMFDAHDNYPANCKHVVDAVAEGCLMVKDNDARISWTYLEQVRAEAHGVRIVVERA